MTSLSVPDKFPFFAILNMDWLRLVCFTMILNMEFLGICFMSWVFLKQIQQIEVVNKTHMCRSRSLVVVS